MRPPDHPDRIAAQLLRRLIALLIGVAAPPAGVGGQTTSQQTVHAGWDSANVRSLPFGPAERLTYTVRTARFGGVGKATMWVDDPTPLRGITVWPLRFEFSARVGPVRAQDHTTSWFDARRGASLRFLKHERHPLSRLDDEVELFPEGRRWSAKNGTTGESPTDAPLDELSFMYFLRTLPLASESDWQFARHYVAERNPTSVRVVTREELQAGTRRFRTVLLEMRVKDPRRYKGDGVIRIHLSDDACRIPVRIESRMPVVGAAVMLLESHNLQGCSSEQQDTLAVTP